MTILGSPLSPKEKIERPRKSTEESLRTKMLGNFIKGGESGLVVLAWSDVEIFSVDVYRIPIDEVLGDFAKIVYAICRSNSETYRKDWDVF